MTLHYAKLSLKIMMLLCVVSMNFKTFAQSNEPGSAGSYPCTTFDDPSQYYPDQYDDWHASRADFYSGGVNPLDGSPYLSMHDQGGIFQSGMGNAVDYRDLGKNYLGKCLCYDFNLEAWDEADGQPPFHPSFTIQDARGRSIRFVSSLTLSPSQDWVTICAPIEHCTGNQLPSNACGHWEYGNGVNSCQEFNEVLDNSYNLFFSADINSWVSEIMNFDNICVKDCPQDSKDPCKFSFSVAAQGTGYIATITGSFDPALYYSIDWGDGNTMMYNPNFGTSLTHIYDKNGCYRVCVTAYSDRFKVVCESCELFCLSMDGDSDENTSPFTKKIRGIAQPGNSISAYPNPFQNDININYFSEEDGTAIIELKDVMGRIVYKEEQKAAKGTQLARLRHIPELSKGIYMISLKVNQKQIGMVKMTKQ